MSVPTIQSLPKLTAPEDVMPWAKAFVDDVWKRLYAIIDAVNNPKLPLYTTVQRDALIVAEGSIIYNTTTAQQEIYLSGSWGAL